MFQKTLLPLDIILAMTLGRTLDTTTLDMTTSMVGTEHLHTPMDGRYRRDLNFYQRGKFCTMSNWVVVCV